MIRFKNNLLLIGITVTMVLYCFWLVVASGGIAGVDSSIDKFRESTKYEQRRKSVREGAIIDRHGDIILETTIETSSDEDVECFRTNYFYDEPYSQLVGYNNSLYGASNIRKKFENYLYYDNDKDGIGATLKLTTDNKLQEYCYNLIGDNEGGVVIIDNDTGEIRALASRSEKDFSLAQLDAKEVALSDYFEYDGFFLNTSTQKKAPPASTFKILTSIAALEEDLDKIKYEDTGYFQTVTGAKIFNHNGQIYGEIGLKEAIGVSSNAYFSNLGVLLGKDKLSEIAARFLIGSEIELDFTTLHSNFELKTADEFEIASTSIGQGKTELSALQLCMVMQSICNEGTMLRPYIVDEVFQGDKVLHECEVDKLTKTVSRKVSKEVLELMQSNAENYFDVSESEYGVAGLKTGTAELHNGLYQSCIMGFSEECSIVIFQRNTYNTGASLLPQFKNILKYIN